MMFFYRADKTRSRGGHFCLTTSSTNNVPCFSAAFCWWWSPTSDLVEKPYSDKGKQGSAERYYDVESVEAIKKIPVADVAADDCVLFLWCVWSQLPEALEVIRAWGFTFKTAGFIWVKTTKNAEVIQLN